MHTTRFFAMIFQMFAQNQKIGGAKFFESLWERKINKLMILL
jgi:hypothetical protein